MSSNNNEMASANCGGGGSSDQSKSVDTSSPIKIYEATTGKHYIIIRANNKPVNRYLGKYNECRGLPRENGYPDAPVYVFEKETIGDHYPVDMLVEVNEMSSSHPITSSQNIAVTNVSNNNVTDDDEMPPLENKDSSGRYPFDYAGAGGGGTKTTETNVGPATMEMFYKSGGAAGPAIVSHIEANGGGKNLTPVQETAKKILNSGTATVTDTLFAAALMTQSICGCRGYGQFCSYCH